MSCAHLATASRDHPADVADAFATACGPEAVRGFSYLRLSRRRRVGDPRSSAAGGEILHASR